MLPLLLSVAAPDSAAPPTTADLNAASARRAIPAPATRPTTPDPEARGATAGATPARPSARAASAIGSAAFPPASASAPARPVAAKPTPAQALAAVQAEWPRYDTGHQGRLGPLEFGTWVMRANGAAVQPVGATHGAPGVKPVTAMNATARAFAAADRNHDGGVTPDEMAAFLAR